MQGAISIKFKTKERGKMVYLRLRRKGGSDIYIEFGTFYGNLLFLFYFLSVIYIEVCVCVCVCVCFFCHRLTLGLPT